MEKQKVMFEKDISESLSWLQRGGVILYPTDTIWGIGCDATNEQSIERIYDIKHRSHQKSMIILLDDVKSVSEYVTEPSPLLLDEMRQTSHPTTAIFANAKNLPHNLLNAHGSIAIRIPADDFCQVLLSRFRKPLISTSANISSQASPQTFSDIDHRLMKAVDYTVHYRRHDHTLRNPSHIIRLNEHGKVERVR